MEHGGRRQTGSQGSDRSGVSAGQRDPAESKLRPYSVTPLRTPPFQSQHESKAAAEDAVGPNERDQPAFSGPFRFHVQG